MSETDYGHETNLLQRDRDALVNQHLPLVRGLAYRYRNRGCEIDDITQVGTIGLIKAVDRYKPEKGVPFAAFAVPYVTGEIKRYFRDFGWSAHVPRRLKELSLSVSRAKREISCIHSEEPTAQTIARHLGIDIAEVMEGISATNAYRAESLEGFAGSEHSALSDRTGSVDPRLEEIEDAHALLASIRKLNQTQRDLLRLRFAKDMTQAQVAEYLGLSQTGVSRLLARTLVELRDLLFTEHGVTARTDQIDRPPGAVSAGGVKDGREASTGRGPTMG